MYNIIVYIAVYKAALFPLDKNSGVVYTRKLLKTDWKLGRSLLAYDFVLFTCALGSSLQSPRFFHDWANQSLTILSHS